MTVFEALMACSDYHRQRALYFEAAAGRSPDEKAWKPRKKMRKHMNYAVVCAMAAEAEAKKGGGE